MTAALAGRQARKAPGVGAPAAAREAGSGGAGSPAATGWQQNPRSRDAGGSLPRTAAAAWDLGRGWALGFLFASRTVCASDNALVSPALLEIV